MKKSIQNIIVILILSIVATITLISCDSGVPFPDNKNTLQEDNLLTKTSTRDTPLYLPGGDIDLRNMYPDGGSPYMWSDLVPVYRYFNQTNKVHYMGLESPNNSSITVKGVKYNYEVQDFLVNRYYSGVPLYRHYSSALKSYRFSLASSISTYNETEMIGFVSPKPTPHTRPLKEYYNPVTNRYHYVILDREISWMAKYEPNFVYVGVVGYVWQGERSEADYDEPQTRAIFRISSQQTGLDAYGVRYLCTNVRVKNYDGVYRESTLFFQTGAASSLNVKLPDYCEVLSVDLYMGVSLMSAYASNLYKNIFRSGFTPNIDTYNMGNRTSYVLDRSKDGLNYNIKIHYRNW